MSRILAYIRDHDNRWSFIVAYISLAVVLAIAINLFYLTLVVAVHGLFEWIKESPAIDDRRARLAHVLWELKLDIGLILFALALEVYMEVLLGMVGLSMAARAGVQASGRFAALQNALRGVLLSVDDAAQVARMVAKRRREGGEAEDDDAEGEDGASPLPAGRLGPWAGPYGLGDKLSLGFGASCLLAIVCAPYLTHHDWSSMLAAIGAEMHPFRF
jgi:hypothetical protein